MPTSQKSRLYRRATRMMDQLGLPRTNYRGWLGTTTEYWRDVIQSIERRDRTFALTGDIRRATFERYLRLANFGAILRDIRHLRPTDDQFRRLFSELSDRKLVVRFNAASVEDGVRTDVTNNLPLSSENVQKFIKMYSETYQGISTREQTGSDILSQLDFATISNMDLVNLDRPTREFRTQGRYFPYLNAATEIDLSTYQIYQQGQKRSSEHCLFFALSRAGVDESKLVTLKSTYIMPSEDKIRISINKKDLKKFAESLQRQIIVHYVDAKGNTRKNKYGSKFSVKIDIALSHGHYFQLEPTKYSTYSIKHYDEIKEQEDFHDIWREGRRSVDKYKLNSLRLVHELDKQGKFQLLDMCSVEMAANHKVSREHFDLSNIAKEQRPHIQPKPKKKSKKKKRKIAYFAADCEAQTSGPCHQLLHLGVCQIGSKHTQIFSRKTWQRGIWCDYTCQRNPDYLDNHTADEMVKGFLSHVAQYGRQDAVVYFHNLKYDYHVLQKYLPIQSVVTKDGQVYSVKCRHGKSKIELRCSYKMISMPLNKFQKALGLPAGKKEAINYNHYTVDNVHSQTSIKEYESGLKPRELNIFREQLSHYSPKDGMFDSTKYYLDYLKLDCQTLSLGLSKFDTILQAIDPRLSVFDSLTISSLADKFMRINGAFDDVYEMTGNLRKYVGKSVMGGRVHVNTKSKKKLIEGRIADYDAVSCYPSAIKRMCTLADGAEDDSKEWFRGGCCGKLHRVNSAECNSRGGNGVPTGPCKRLTEPEKWEMFRYAVMTVQIHEVRKKQQMPFIAHRGDGTIDYRNTAPAEPVYLDTYQLQDYIKFHDITFTVLDGVYWDGGCNRRMGELTQRLFDRRLEAKKEKNTALSTLLKLMLNSAYGKTVMKSSHETTRIVNTMRQDGDQWLDGGINDYIYNRFETVKSYRKISCGRYEVVEHCADDSYNRAHIGCAILSLSKRIMNEVFDCANSIGAPIYYTDTDSMHLNYDDVPRVEAEFKRQYGAELNGKQLGQFHVDFDLDGACGEIVSVKSIFLGKKSYFDLLESVDADGKKIHGEHIRMKGVTKEGLDWARREYGDGSYEQFYQRLADGEELVVDLMPPDPNTGVVKFMPVFENGRVASRMAFSRTCKF